MSHEPVDHQGGLSVFLMQFSVECASVSGFCTKLFIFTVVCDLISPFTVNRKHMCGGCRYELARVE